MTTLANANSTSTLDAAAVEVAVRWGDALLAVHHLCPARDFHVGGDASCDFVVAGDMPRTAIVMVENGRAFAVSPVAGERIALEPGAAMSFELGALRFELRAVEAAERIAPPARRPGRGLAAVALAAAVHGGLLAATAFMVPSMLATEDDVITEEQRYLMQQYLDAAAEIEREVQAGDPLPGAPGDGDPTAPPESIAARGPGGPAGASRPGLPHLPRGPVGSDMGREELIDFAKHFGMNDLVTGMEAGPMPGEWALTDGAPMGGDPTVWGGDLVGNPLELGNPGGEGSDMRGNWYTNSGIPSLNACTSPPCGQGGFRPSFLARQKHEARSPILRGEKTQVDQATIPPEVIQRVVRSNFGRFRACYENGLRKNPSLEGRVAVRFLIDRDGTVGMSTDGGSSIPDAGVVGCVVGAFRGLSFPAPERGVVTVTYPILFVPAGA
jgi:hypothetical protein